MPRSPWLIPGIVGTVWVTVMGYFLLKGYRESRQTVKLAIIGNSFQFVNDLPRVLEYFGNGRLQQDSVLHGSLNLYTMTRKGNGMGRRWNSSETGINADGYIDYGACTMIQLLMGKDPWLENYKAYYKDDGKNPCFTDADYLKYAKAIRSPQSRNVSSEDYISFQESVPGPPWDFVLMNDQSMRPTNWNNKRDRSVYALETIYAPLIERAKATPILFMTWAYWREDWEQMSYMVDIPTFTRQLYRGYQYYAEVLQQALPPTQRPRIAPVGLAYLVIWEENPSFWEDKMFSPTDQYHPSPHGTYLAACVVYSTMYGHLPPAWTRFTDHVFARSRRMELDGDPLPLPTEDEAIYLRDVAARVALRGYIPESLASIFYNG